MESEEILSKRLDRWEDFSFEVQDHIENYTVPQYGDYPKDQMTSFTVDEFLMNMKRYLNRIGRDARGKENSILDCRKIAHYACELCYKLEEEK